MRKIHKACLLLFLFLTSLTCIVKAQDYPEKSNTLVTDYTNTLSLEQKNALENKLVTFNDSSSTQIAVVLMNSMDGYPIDEYARTLAEKWGIGQKGKNNGVLLMVALKDRKMTIQVGYGLEAVIPDALAKRIIEIDIKPSFKEGDYYTGIDKGTNTLIALAKGEFKADKYGAVNEDKPFPGFIVFIILGIIAIVLFSKFRSVKNYSNMNHISFWAAWALMNAASNRHSGRWSDFSSGGGHFGGGSSGGGGGFGGFGGGSFGGGGSSGSW